MSDTGIYGSNSNHHSAKGMFGFPRNGWKVKPNHGKFNNLPPITPNDLKDVVKTEWTESCAIDTSLSDNTKDDVQTDIHLNHSITPSEQKETHQEIVTTESIVQELLAQGLSLDQIVMPGGAKGMILFIADDFDAPLEEFEDYV